LGDTGYLDDRGRLWLCGRKSHRVVTRSRTLYPLRCEPVFNAHPKVEKSALVGVEKGGRTEPAMCIVPAGGSANRDAGLLAELRAHAALFEQTRSIERFEILDALPVDRRHNAKIDRPGLARRLGRQGVS
jgi:acyl-coenzyme A synthetase/AMP-(fatty) acid ligase